MSPRPTSCTYLMDGFELTCGLPVLVDVYDYGELSGPKWLVSLCSRHWTSRAKAAAAGRRCIVDEHEPSETTLEAVPA